MIKLVKKGDDSRGGEAGIKDQMRKQVTFCRVVDVAEIPRSSFKLHYSRNEMKSIQNEVRSTITYYKQLKEENKMKGTMLMFREKSHFCTRGIEDHLDTDLRQEKKRTKLLAVLAVRLEQDRQWTENKAFTPNDIDIARCYERVCKRSQDEANKRGINDQNEVQKMSSQSLRINKGKGGRNANEEQLSSPKIGRIIHQRILPRFFNPVSSAASHFVISRKTMTSKAA